MKTGFHKASSFVTLIFCGWYRIVGYQRIAKWPGINGRWCHMSIGTGYKSMANV